MAMQNDATIINASNSKSFYFRAINNWKFIKNQPAMPIPIIDNPPENNYLFRFTGQTEGVSFDFILTDDGTDVANGTHTSAVTTLNEQIEYLREDIYTSEYDTTWTFSDNKYFGGITCIITDLNIKSMAGQPTIATGTISILRGQVVSI